MGLPQPLIDPLREIEQADVSRPVETLWEATDASLQETLSALSKAVRNLERGEARIREASQAVHENAEEEISAGGASPDLDEQIDSIAKLEEELKQSWLPHIELVRSVQAGTFRLPKISPEQKAALVRVLERFTQTNFKILATLRDLRWDLMALRAEAEDPGEVPVFDNAQDLLGYLKIPPK